MITRLLRLLAVFGLLSIARMGAGEADAEIISALTTYDPAKMPVVVVRLDSLTESLYAGPLTTTIWDGSTLLRNAETSYCVDVVGELPQVRVGAQLSTESGMVSKAQGGTQYDRNIGAAAWLLTNIRPTDATSGAALQVAIWEAIYDYDGTRTGSANLQAGHFRLTTTGAIFNLAAGYLDQIRDISSSTYRTATALFVNYPDPGTSPFAQDQIMAAVPEPSSLALAFMGGCGCLLVVRRKRMRRVGSA